LNRSSHALGGSIQPRLKISKEMKEDGTPRFVATSPDLPSLRVEAENQPMVVSKGNAALYEAILNGKIGSAM